MDSNDIVEFLELRRSFSALGLTAPGPDEPTLARMLRIAARVPDHGKLAPWRFLVIEGDAKAKLQTELEAIARSRADGSKLDKGLMKLSRPPLCVAVISRVSAGPIPEWEQVLSAGAVCMNLLTAALALGFGANWLTEWYAYDAEARPLLGLEPGERVAGMVMIGTGATRPDERPRPDPAKLVTRLAL
ncbi:MAG: nitroreductase [Novosphingobium sp.]